MNGSRFRTVNKTKSRRLTAQPPVFLRSGNSAGVRMEASARWTALADRKKARLPGKGRRADGYTDLFGHRVVELRRVGGGIEIVDGQVAEEG